MTPCGPAPEVAAEAPASDALDGSCLFAELAVAGRAFATVPDAGVARSVQLRHARTALGVRTGLDVQLRAAVVAVRSGGDQGYIGIAGESLVPAFEIAEARWDWRAVGWAVAGGLVDDPWVASLEEAWGRRDVSPVLATDQAWMDRSDAGGWLSWTAPEGLATVTLALTTGEGASRRERNDGTNLTAVAHLRPLEGQAFRLEALAMAREGSRGLGQAPDHRAGAALVARHEAVVLGLEGLTGWGLAGDGALRPAGASLWARTGEALPAVGWVRADVGRDQVTDARANEVGWFVGGGPRLPLDGPMYLAAGWEGRRLGRDAATLAGSTTLRAIDTVFVQLGAEVGGSLTGLR